MPPRLHMIVATPQPWKAVVSRAHQQPLRPQDVFKTQAQIEAAGGKITRKAGAIPGLGTKIVRSTLHVAPSYRCRIRVTRSICTPCPTAKVSSQQPKEEAGRLLRHADNERAPYCAWKSAPRIEWVPPSDTCPARRRSPPRTRTATSTSSWTTRTC